MRVGFIITLFATLLATAVEAGEFRRITYIPRVKKTPASMVDMGNRKPVKKIHPVSREVVEAAMRQAFSNFTSPDFGAFLSDTFAADKTRLMDSIGIDVPRDARLEIVSVQRVQTLEQWFVPPEKKEPPKLISSVVATVKAQLEFNDAGGSGFQRREGTSDYVFELTQILQKKKIK